MIGSVIDWRAIIFHADELLHGVLQGMSVYIVGEDQQLNKNMVPTAVSDVRGGKRVDLTAGVSHTTSAGV